MSRFLTLILTLALTSFAPAQICPPGGCPPVQTETNPRATGVAQAVVMLSMDNHKGGSGTSVPSGSPDVGLIISADHVTSGATEGTATFFDGVRVRVRVIAGDPRTDLSALTFVATTETHRTAIADRAPARGARLWKVGYPAGRSSPGCPSVLAGECISCDGELRTSIYVSSGDSGGGYFDSEGGLVGAVTGFRTPAVERSFGPGYPQLVTFYRETCLPLCRRGQPPAKPSVPSVPPETKPGPTPAPDMSALLGKLDVLQKQIENIKPIPGPPGPPGADGKPGDRGPAGPPGPKGELGTDPALRAELDALRREVAALRASIRPASGSIEFEVDPNKK